MKTIPLLPPFKQIQRFERRIGKIKNRFFSMNKWLAFSIIFFGLFGVYLAINQIPMYRFAYQLNAIEKRIPFLPWSFTIYFSIFLQIAIVIHRSSQKLFRELIGILIPLVILYFILFLSLPLRYPAENYPSDNSFICSLRKIDVGNCYPSLHVALTIIFSFAYGYIQKQRKLRILMWMWSLLIILSVLTTKQHYLLDVVASIVLTIVWWIRWGIPKTVDRYYQYLEARYSS